MSVISLSKIHNVLPEFVDSRLMPSAPSVMKWILGGSTFLILRQADDIISQYLPMMKSFGLVNDQNQLNIELTKGFINSAFSKSGTISLFGFNFDKTDGEAFIGILEKYKDV